MKHKGFTLIELIAAVALAAMLMMLLAAVATNTREIHAAWTHPNNHHDANTGVLELIRHDLAHARRIDSARNTLVITGFGGIDRASLSPTHLPARVTYRLIASSSHQHQLCLVREQGNLNSRSNHPPFVEVVAVGVSNFELCWESSTLGTLDETGVLLTPAVAAVNSANQGQKQSSAINPPDELPDHATFVLSWADGSEPLNEMIFLR